MYSREAHTPRAAAAAYRAAGWLAGAPGRQQYSVAAAGLGADGKQAALLVQGVPSSDAGAVSNATLKVFAADTFGHWSDVCSIPVGTPPSKAGKTGGLEPTHILCRSQWLPILYATLPCNPCAYLPLQWEASPVAETWLSDCFGNLTQFCVLRRCFEAGSC
jgi:hypothetical protein